MGKKLNTAQQKAVCHETGPMLVLAGPGSGKTTVLLCRISRLLERGLAKPQEILALTFSKAAAEEMKSRFENLNGASGVSFGTFHSIFFRILRSRYGWNVEQIFQEEAALRFPENYSRPFWQREYKACWQAPVSCRIRG